MTFLDESVEKRETSPLLHRVNSFGNDYHVSLLRCQHAELCRLQDQGKASGQWRVRVAQFVQSGMRQGLRIGARCVDGMFGSVRTIGNLSDVSRHCEGAEVVSLDVFDTLLYRTVEPPDFLKRRTANYAEQLFSSRGFPVTADLFMYLRNESEARLRRQAQTGGSDAECKLSDIIHEVLYRLFGAEDAVAETADLVRYELEVECHHLRVATETQELLEGLKSRGQRVIVATDTYLERKHIQEIFIHLGIDRYIDSIYPSSEYGVGKYSGRLFQRILETEAIPPTKMVHVGDTYESDVRGAVKAGIPAIFLRDCPRLHRRWRLARLTSRVVAGAEVNEAVAIGATPLPENSRALNAEERELYTIGRDILGPAFTLFVLDVIQECYRTGVSVLYYLAREGLLLRRLHEILSENIHRFKRLPPLRHQYLYVSRLATSLPAVRELGPRELHLAFYRDSSASLAECISAFGLKAAEFSDLEVDFEDREKAAKERLFADPFFVSRVKIRAASERLRLRRYLSQEGFFGANEIKALVDVGWNATIQANLTRAFQDDPEFPMLIGHYFGRRYKHDDYLVSARSLYMPGRLFDQKRNVQQEQAIGHCLEMFELAAGASHGATVGYEERESSVNPILSKSGAALSTEQRLLQAGIIDCAASFSRTYNDYEIDSELLRRDATRRLANFILAPTMRQVMALKSLAHPLDWGSQETRPLIAANINPLFIFTPRRLLSSLRACYWLEGSLRMLRIPAALFVLSLVRRTVRSKHILQRLSGAYRNFFRRRVSVSSE